MTEEEVKNWFIQAINQLLCHKEEILANLSILLELKEKSDYESQLQHLETESRIVSQMVEKLVRENAKKPQNQDEYQKQYHQLTERYEQLIERMERLEQEQMKQAKAKTDIQTFIGYLEKESGLITEFDELLWEAIISNLTIAPDKKITISFKNGTVLSI